MRLPKDVADRMARKFRAELNKAAKDGLVHACHYWLEDKTTISFEVTVMPAAEVRSVNDSKG